MRLHLGGESGVTWLEVLVVLSVAAALAVTIVPLVFTSINIARTKQATAEAQRIAAAINKLFTDTGRWPFCKNCQGEPGFQSGAAALLTSNAACNGSTALRLCDSRSPTDGTAGGLWALSTSSADSLANHLITNTPFRGAGGTPYATTGPRPWQGPYLKRVPTTDPWGRSYLVNISKADPNDSTPEAVWVLSAGANGIIETNGDTLATANPSVGGDDVAARAK